MQKPNAAACLRRATWPNWATRLSTIILAAFILSPEVRSGPLCAVADYSVRSYGLPSGSLSHAVADFDNDGIVDLLMTFTGPDFSSTHVVILKGVAGGVPDVYQPLLFEVIDVWADSIHVADYNGDGNLDLAVTPLVATDGTLETMLYPGTGSGTFLEPVVLFTHDAQATGYPGAWRMRSTDLNHDDHLDFVLFGYALEQIAVYLSDGGGGYSGLPTIDTGRPYSSRPVIHDMDNDGNLDIVLLITNFLTDTTQTRLYRGQGNGAFYPPTDTDHPLDHQQLAVGDLNGDQLADIVLSGERWHENYWLIALQDTNGDFVQAGEAQPGGRGDVLAIADVNGDAWNDIFIPQLGWQVNQGDNTFRDTIDVYEWNARQVTVTDINGDGVPDLTFSEGDYVDVSVWITECGPDCDEDTILDADEIADCDGDPNCTDCNANEIPDGCDLLANPDLDCNQDGVLDMCETICIADWDGNGCITASEGQRLLNRLNGPDQINLARVADCSAHDQRVFDHELDGDLDLHDLAETARRVGSTCDGPVFDEFTIDLTAKPNSLALGDLNLDGHLDVVVGHKGKSVDVLLGRGDGSFATPWTAATINSPGWPTIGLLDADPYPDLIVGHGSGAFTQMLNDGSGLFLDAHGVSYPNMYSRYVSITDIDGDGVNDVLTGSDQALEVLFGNGDGTYTGQVFDPQLFRTRFSAAADFNGDGLADIVAVERGHRGVVNVSFGQGEPIWFARFHRSSWVLTPDLNHDGQPDLLLGTDQITILLNDGDGVFRPLEYLYLGIANSASFPSVLADCSGDAVDDLVSINSRDEKLTIHIGKSYGSFDDGFDYLVGAAPIAVAAGDLNGDGRTDLAVTLPTNQLAVLLNRTCD